MGLYSGCWRVRASTNRLVTYDGLLMGNWGEMSVELTMMIFECLNYWNKKGTSANAGPHYQKLYARVTHIWGNRRSQPSRSAMRGPHPERTSYVIKVPLASGKYANGWKWDDLIGRCYGVCCGNGPLGVGQMVKNNCSFRNNIKDIVKVYLRFATRDFMVRWLFSWLTAISWLWISLCRGWPTGKKEKMFWVSEMFLMFDWC